MAVGLGCNNMKGYSFDKWCLSDGTESCTLACLLVLNTTVSHTFITMDIPDILLHDGTHSEYITSNSNCRNGIFSNGKSFSYFVYFSAYLVGMNIKLTN